MNNVGKKLFFVTHIFFGIFCVDRIEQQSLELELEYSRVINSFQGLAFNTKAKKWEIDKWTPNGCGCLSAFIGFRPFLEALCLFANCAARGGVYVLSKNEFGNDGAVAESFLPPVLRFAHTCNEDTACVCYESAFSLCASILEDAVCTSVFYYDEIRSKYYCTTYSESDQKLTSYVCAPHMQRQSNFVMIEACHGLLWMYQDGTHLYFDVSSLE